MKRQDLIRELEELDIALALDIAALAGKTTLPWYVLLESAYRGAVARLMQEKPTGRLANHETLAPWGPPRGTRENAPLDPSRGEKPSGTLVSSDDGTHYTIREPQGKTAVNARAEVAREKCGYKRGNGEENKKTAEDDAGN